MASVRRALTQQRVRYGSITRQDAGAPDRQVPSTRTAQEAVVARPSEPLSLGLGEAEPELPMSNAPYRIPKGSAALRTRFPIGEMQGELRSCELGVWRWTFHAFSDPYPVFVPRMPQLRRGGPITNQQ